MYYAQRLSVAFILEIHETENMTRTEYTTILFKAFPPFERFLAENSITGVTCKCGALIHQKGSQSAKTKRHTF